MPLVIWTTAPGAIQHDTSLVNCTALLHWLAIAHSDTEPASWCCDLHATENPHPAAHYWVGLWRRGTPFPTQLTTGASRAAVLIRPAALKTAVMQAQPPGLGLWQRVLSPHPGSSWESQQQQLKSSCCLLAALLAAAALAAAAMKAQPMMSLQGSFATVGTMSSRSVC